MSEDDYAPVSCDYHDQLEAAAVTRKEVVLEFEDKGVRQKERGRIGDVYTAEGAEFVRLNATHGDREIRLDRIVSIREVG
jgi:Rho-binding antiterminator